VLKPGDPEGVGEMALEAAIRNALERESLSAEVARLGAQMPEDPDGAQLCWRPSVAMRPVMDMVERIADSDVDVLIRGESGVGKDVVARELHRRSDRRSKPFVKVNCAALPADLLESELFGHERGAFTGAGTTRIGKFEFAQHGTVMLDEIGEMPPALQAKILHVLQDRQFTRLGSNRPIDANVRVLAATNRNLEAMMRAGNFREDLYYRLQVIELRVPALRDRREEIVSLVEFFLAKYARVYRRPPLRPSQLLIETILDYSWPGNIRELENMMKRFVVLQDESLVLSELAHAKEMAAAAHVTTPAPPPSAPAPSSEATYAAVAPPASAEPPSESVPAVAAMGSGAMEGFDSDATSINLQTLARTAAMRAEREAIEQALVRFRWNRRKTAEYLSVSYKTLLNKIKECGITDSGVA
jgi:DNA-binding NtrC family response regulator